MKIKECLLNTKKNIKKIPEEIKYILGLFFVTRIALSIIGVLSLKIVGPYLARPINHFSNFSALKIWGFWDTDWYLEIAKFGYSAFIKTNGQANYGFFPLYPMLIKFFSFIFQDYFISALIVSNLFLILAAIFLYKLARLDSDEKTSMRIVKYLFVFPAAFVLSATLSESLFLFLIISCLYYAKKQKWLLSGLSGMFLALTKPFGIIMIIPVLYEYLKNKKNYEVKNILKSVADIYSILLIPFGLVAFAVYTYFLTGDIFAYPHIKLTGWGNHLTNPINVIYSGVTSANLFYVWQTITAISVIALLIFFYRKIGFSYFLAGISLALFGIIYTGSIYSIGSISRYYTAIFPIYIIFGKISENEKIDEFLMFFLLLLQGFLMIYWKI